jgi:hypothetical protein
VAADLPFAPAGFDDPSRRAPVSRRSCANGSRVSSLYRSRRRQRHGKRIAAQHHGQYQPTNRLFGRPAKQLRHIHDRGSLNLDRMGLGLGGGLRRPQSGERTSFALPLGDQLGTGLALRVDGIERAIGARRLGTSRHPFG